MFPLFNSIVPEDGTVENDTEVKGDGDRAASETAEERTGAADEALDVNPPAAEDREAEAADPVGLPADKADDDGSALANFPACLPGDWNTGKSKKVSTYRKCSDLSGWVEQLVPRKAANKSDKYYLCSDGGRFRSLTAARNHAAGVATGSEACPTEVAPGRTAVSLGQLTEACPAEGSPENAARKCLPLNQTVMARLLLVEHKPRRISRQSKEVARPGDGEAQDGQPLPAEEPKRADKNRACNKSPSFEQRIEFMRQYKAVHGDVNVRQRFSEGDGAGKNLGQWVNDQRRLKKKGTLSAERIAMLNGKSSWIMFSSRADRSENSHPSHARYQF